MILKWQTYGDWNGKVSLSGVADTSVDQEIEVPDGGFICFEIEPGRWISFLHSEWASCHITGKPLEEYPE